MPLTTSGLGPSLNLAIERKLAGRVRDAEICVIGSGPLISKRLEDTTRNDWKLQFERLEKLIDLAQRAAFNASLADRPAHIVVITHPIDLFRQAGFMLNAVNDAVLAGMVELRGVSTTAGTSIRSNVISCQYAEWGLDTSDSTTVSSNDIATLVEYLTSPEARYIDGSVLGLDHRGFVVTKMTSGNPLTGD